MKRIYCWYPFTVWGLTTAQIEQAVASGLGALQNVFPIPVLVQLVLRVRPCLWSRMLHFTGNQKIIKQTKKKQEKQQTKKIQIAPDCFVFVSFLFLFCFVFVFLFLGRLRNPKSAFSFGKKTKHSGAICFIFFAWFVFCFLFVCCFLNIINYFHLSNECMPLDVISLCKPCNKALGSKHVQLQTLEKHLHLKKSQPLKTRSCPPPPLTLPALEAALDRRPHHRARMGRKTVFQIFQSCSIQAKRATMSAKASARTNNPTSRLAIHWEMVL